MWNGWMRKGDCHMLSSLQEVETPLVVFLRQCPKQKQNIMNESLPLLDTKTHKIKISAVHWWLSSSQVDAQVPCLSTSYPIGSIVRNRSDGVWLLRLGHTRLHLVSCSFSLTACGRPTWGGTQDSWQPPAAHEWSLEVYPSALVRLSDHCGCGWHLDYILLKNLEREPPS